MSNSVPIGQFKPLCPHCGAQLGLKSGDVENKDEGRRVFCPTHGDVGSLKEIGTTVLNQNRDAVIKKAREIALKAFKKR